MHESQECKQWDDFQRRQVFPFLMDFLPFRYKAEQKLFAASLRPCVKKRPCPTTEFRLTGSARFRCGRNLILNLTDSTENRDSPKIGKNLPLPKLI
jgi:hypothetical protein